MRKWLVALAVMLVLAVLGGQALQIRNLSKALADMQVAEKIRKAAAESDKTGQPVEAEVDIARFIRAIGDLNKEIARLRVQVESEKNPPPGVQPGTIVTAPPIEAPTPEAAENAARQADQRIDFKGRVRMGTLMWVCEVALVGGVCPAGKEVSLPLSRSFEVEGTLIRTAAGVFTSINIANAPLAISEIKTTTRIVEVKIPTLQVQPEYFGGTAVAFVSSGSLFAFGGGTYENFAYGGLYKIGVGASYNSARGGISVPTYMIGFTKPF